MPRVSSDDESGEYPTVDLFQVSKELAVQKVQIRRIVADIESEKGTRNRTMTEFKIDVKDLQESIKSKFQEIEETRTEQFKDINKKLDRHSWMIALATGALMTVELIVKILPVLKP